MPQLNNLAKPFDARLIEQKGGHDYVSHSSVTERALATVGPYSIEHVQLVTEADGRVTGALVTICCEIDGRTVRITEAGESENPTSKTNGAKAKDAISDAVKRCWMRLGLGLHLWSGKAYVLDKILGKETASVIAPKPPQQSARANTQLPPSKAENTQTEQTPTGIGADRGAAMEQHIRERGFSDTQIAVFLASSIERNVATCAELTEREVRDVLAEVKRIEGERKKNKTDDEPPFDPDPEPDDEPANFAPNGPGSRILTNIEASNLHKALAQFSIKEHYDFASEVMGRKINSLQACTVAVSTEIYEAAVYKHGSESQIAEYDARKAAAA